MVKSPAAKRKDKSAWEPETARTLRPKAGFSGFVDNYQKAKLLDWAEASIAKGRLCPGPVARGARAYAEILTGTPYADENKAWELLYRLRIKSAGK